MNREKQSPLEGRGERKPFSWEGLKPDQSPTPTGKKVRDEQARGGMLTGEIQDRTQTERAEGTTEERKRFQWSNLMGAYIRGEGLIKSPKELRAMGVDEKYIREASKDRKERITDFESKDGQVEYKKDIDAIGGVSVGEDRPGYARLQGEAMMFTLTKYARIVGDYRNSGREQKAIAILGQLEGSLGQIGTFKKIGEQPKFIFDQQIAEKEPGRVHHLRWFAEFLRQEGRPEEAQQVDDTVDAFMQVPFKEIGLEYQGGDERWISAREHAKGIRQATDERGLKSQKFFELLFHNGLYPVPYQREKRMSEM